MMLMKVKIILNPDIVFLFTCKSRATLSSLAFGPSLDLNLEPISSVFIDFGFEVWDDELLVLGISSMDESVFPPG